MIIINMNTKIKKIKLISRAIIRVKVKVLIIKAKIILWIKVFSLNNLKIHYFEHIYDSNYIQTAV